MKNLIGTNWVFKKNIGTANLNLRNIIFISNGNKYTQLSRSYTEGSVDTLVFNDSNSSINVYVDGVFSKEQFRIISIIGGSSAYDSDLINWLESNAVKVSVTNLSNTKWTIKKPSEWKDITINFDYNSLQAEDALNINCVYKASTYSIEGSSIIRNYYISPYDNTVNDSLKVASAESNTDYPNIRYWIVYDPSTGLITSSGFRYNPTWTTHTDLGDIESELEITGGPDVRDPNFIVWLETNAILLETKTNDKLIIKSKKVSNLCMNFKELFSDIKKIFFGTTKIYEKNGYEMIVDDELTITIYFGGRMILFNRNQFATKYGWSISEEAGRERITWYRKDVAIMNGYYCSSTDMKEYLPPGEYYCTIKLNPNESALYPKGVLIKTRTVTITAPQP